MEYNHIPPATFLEGRGTQSGALVDIMGNFALFDDIIRLAAGASGDDLGGNQDYSDKFKWSERINLSLLIRESTYRTWERQKIKGPKSIYLDELCRQLQTALSIAKWQDFTMKQSNITHVNGWKAYYAATRATMNVNANFFNVIRQQSLPAMGRLWINADYVKCIHVSTGELFSGYNSVVESFQ